MTASELDDLIRYEREHTALDFKRIPYRPEQHAAFLKDVLSMANAAVDGYRHIVCGVEMTPDGGRRFLGVTTSELRDQAHYEQLVRENIEPDVPLAYFTHELDGVPLAVFRIGPCPERPYAMRKDFERLLRGEMWVRKGSQQMRMTRADLERIYAERTAATAFEGSLELRFEGAGTMLDLTAVIDDDLPSRRLRARIEQILSDRAVRKRYGMISHDLFSRGAYLPGYSVPLDHRTTEELQDALTRIDEDYEDDDAYELFERRGHRVNILIDNTGTGHVEDARLDVTFDTVPGLTVADREHSEPSHDPRFPSFGVIRHRDDPQYPEVTLRSGIWHVTSEIGDLRHGIATPAFGVPLRVAPLSAAVGQEIAVRCVLRAKNLKQPLERSLTIKVTVPPANPTST